MIIRDTMVHSGSNMLLVLIKLDKMLSSKKEIIATGIIMDIWITSFLILLQSLKLQSLLQILLQ